MDNNKEEKSRFHIIDIFRNKQYYAIANLSFWFIIIIILIVMMRISNPSVNSDSIKTSTNVENEFVSNIDGFTNIKNKNFKFKYILTLSNEEIIYDGKQRNDKILFNDIKLNKEYYVQNDMVLEKEGTNYVLSKNPVKYFNYLDIDLIEKILLNSHLEENEYIISCTDFSKNISDEKEFNDEYIYIQLIKTNDIITKVIIDLGEYVNAVDSNIKSAKLELQYYDFNQVEDFNIN